MRLRGLAAAAAVAVLAVSCGDVEDTSSSDGDLAEAMCTDLENGFSLFQVHRQAVEHYGGRSDDAAQLAAAELEDLATREHCPAFRDEFEATIAYETWIAPGE